MKIKTIKLKINNDYDRHDMVKSLTNSGIKVWVEEKESLYETHYYVYFEIEDDKIN